MEPRTGHDRSAWAALAFALIAIINSGHASAGRDAAYKTGSIAGRCALAFVLCAAAVYFARRSRSPIREIQMALAATTLVASVTLALV